MVHFYKNACFYVLSFIYELSNNAVTLNVCSWDPGALQDPFRDLGSQNHFSNNIQTSLPVSHLLSQERIAEFSRG